MSLVSFAGIGVLIFVVRGYIEVYKNKATPSEKLKSQLASILVLGSVAFFLGWLGHLIGIYGAVEAIQSVEIDISPQLLAGGLRVSLIPFLYGLIVMIISALLWLPLYLKINSHS